jgi:phage tail-like protein
MAQANSYPTGFYFELSFKGEDSAFQEVSGMSKELGIEEVACGGINNFKYKLPTAATNQNLVLKRALVPEGSQLVDWCASCTDLSFAKPIATHDVSLYLLNPDGTTCIMWTFHNAYPIKYSVSDLKSQESSLVIESIELAYTYFEVSPDTLFGNLFD